VDVKVCAPLPFRIKRFQKKAEQHQCDSIGY
jgi:hypothetical protein